MQTLEFKDGKRINAYWKHRLNIQHFNGIYESFPSELIKTCLVFDCIRTGPRRTSRKRFSIGSDQMNSIQTPFFWGGAPPCWSQTSTSCLEWKGAGLLGPVLFFKPGSNSNFTVGLSGAGAFEDIRKSTCFLLSVFSNKHRSDKNRFYCQRWNFDKSSQTKRSFFHLLCKKGFSSEGSVWSSRSRCYNPDICFLFWSLIQQFQFKFPCGQKRVSFQLVCA